MLTKEIEFFDLRQICNSGQCFRMRETGENRFSVMAGGRYLEAGRKESRSGSAVPRRNLKISGKGILTWSRTTGCTRRL